MSAFLTVSTKRVARASGSNMYFLHLIDVINALETKLLSEL